MMDLRGSVRRLLPFLAWFPVPRSALKADVLAGIAVALVLVPQSMAYAQLAGMPPHYGLYASLLPVAVGALDTRCQLEPNSAATIAGTIAQ